MESSIDSIYMVEASRELQVSQQKLLCGKDAPLTESKVGLQSVCKYGDKPVTWTQTIKAVRVQDNKSVKVVDIPFASQEKVQKLPEDQVLVRRSSSFSYPSLTSRDHTGACSRGRPEPYRLEDD